ncbi:hypothetical protein PIB30_064288 [Stylosanthes scabra]|uniref:Uncharacterized protein n=1 Tax=Stylosanthes scabra TaxID=79078 RepID=A0ABU6WNA2_9FABA|nr:hypothetical protein [Stylosanthes scabra]
MKLLQTLMLTSNKVGFLLQYRLAKLGFRKKSKAKFSDPDSTATRYAPCFVHAPCFVPLMAACVAVNMVSRQCSVKAFSEIQTILEYHCQILFILCCSSYIFLHSGILK